MNKVQLSRLLALERQLKASVEDGRQSFNLFRGDTRAVLYAISLIKKSVAPPQDGQP